MLPSRSWVVYYVLEAGVSPTGKLTYRCGLQKNVRVSQDRPIDRIMVAPMQQKLLVVCESKLQLLQMHTLRPVDDHKPICVCCALFPFPSSLPKSHAHTSTRIPMLAHVCGHPPGMP